MRAHFPDTKSAALACEQIASAGYPLNHFRLEKPKAGPAKSSRPVAHGSLWDRIRRAFSSGADQGEAREDAQPASLPEPEDQACETIVFSPDTVDAVIRSIIVQHGGYLEPSPARPSGDQPSR